jgi:hypothetical protein
VVGMKEEQKTADLERSAAFAAKKDADKLVAQ